MPLPHSGWQLPLAVAVTLHATQAVSLSDMMIMALAMMMILMPVGPVLVASLAPWIVVMAIIMGHGTGMLRLLAVARVNGTGKVWHESLAKSGMSNGDHM